MRCFASCAAALIAAGGLLVLVPARASSAEPEDDRAESKAAASKALRDGNALFARKDYQRALETYQAAFEMYPSPKLYYSLARAHHRLGHAEEAATFYDLFLAESGVKVSSALAIQARRGLERVSQGLSQVEFDCGVEGVRIKIDGIYRVRLPARAVYVAPGKRTILGELPGYLPFTKDIHLRPGRLQAVSIEMRPIGEPVRDLGTVVAQRDGASGSDAARTPIDSGKLVDDGGEAEVPLDSGDSFLGSPWFWGVVGAVVVVGAGTAALLASSGRGAAPPIPELGSSRFSDWIQD
ncbi:MAG: tetratricopeptide repeat protein [Deltaproteobacteria bacterium]|nr:tetratricopeptide repeat protein [Deltaproteobacteria bacterium]